MQDISEKFYVSRSTRYRTQRTRLTQSVEGTVELPFPSAITKALKYDGDGSLTREYQRAVDGTDKHRILACVKFHFLSSPSIGLVLPRHATPMARTLSRGCIEPYY